MNFINPIHFLLVFGINHQHVLSYNPIYEYIEQWRIRPLTEEYPYIYVDGVFLKRSWGGEVKNVSILTAIGVNKDGYREILGAAEGMKEDKESWKNFFIFLKKRGCRESVSS